MLIITIIILKICEGLQQSTLHFQRRECNLIPSKDTSHTEMIKLFISLPPPSAWNSRRKRTQQSGSSSRHFRELLTRIGTTANLVHVHRLMKLQCTYRGERGRWGEGERMIDLSSILLTGVVPATFCEKPRSRYFATVSVLRTSSVNALCVQLAVPAVPLRSRTALSSPASRSRLFCPPGLFVSSRFSSGIDILGVTSKLARLIL